MTRNAGSWDVLVVGSGIAGLRSALALADRWKVLLVTKKRISESATNYAQGGISAVLGHHSTRCTIADDTGFLYTRSGRSLRGASEATA